MKSEATMDTTAIIGFTELKAATQDFYTTLASFGTLAEIGPATADAFHRHFKAYMEALAEESARQVLGLRVGDYLNEARFSGHRYQVTALAPVKIVLKYGRLEVEGGARLTRILKSGKLSPAFIERPAYTQIRAGFSIERTGMLSTVQERAAGLDAAPVAD